MNEYLAMADKSFAEVSGRRMAYVEMGEGRPIVFLHGNPTSSYLWRNIMPAVADLGRCIAPDLIGMGDSDKLPDSGPDRYRYQEHRDYLWGLFDAIDVRRDVVFVVHDWGSSLGFEWGLRHPGAVRGFAYMEAIPRPRTWSEFPENTRPAFEALRGPAGERMILDENVFVEKLLPSGILRTLSEEEMAEYRRPFLNPGEDRRPTQVWPREIPIDGEPADVHAIVAEYSAWMATNDIPKLFINAEPGRIIREDMRDFCRTWRNQREITVKGVHFVQEDAPGEIAAALRDFLIDLD